MTGPSEAPAPFRGSGPFLKIVPDPSLPLRHFAFAALALWTFSAAFFWGADRLVGFDFRARWVLGLVHTLTLGWVSMTIFGALSQMLPAHGETPLKAPRLVGAAWALLALGLLGFVGALWAGSDRYWIPACLLMAAVALYLSLLGATLASAKRWDWTSTHFALAMTYLGLVALLGLLLAYDRQRGVLFRDPQGALIAHVHLALVGWVSMPILGASYRLVFPFGLSRLESKLPGRAALALVNAGLIGLSLDALWGGRRLLGLWACLLAAGYLFFISQLRPLIGHEHKKLDPGLAFSLLGLGGGLIWVCLGVALAFGWIYDSNEARAAYVWSALLGFVTPYILGQIHKILPFLVWLHVYSPREWSPPVNVPKIDDLTSRGLAWSELLFLAAAYFLGLAGFWRESVLLLRAAGGSLLAAATLYLVNTVRTLSHLLRPDPRWTPPVTKAP